MSLLRRVSAAVLVAAMFGWLSTLAPQDGELRLTAAQNKAPAAGSEAPRAGSETPGTGDGASAAGSEAPKPKPPPDCTKVKCVALTFDDGPTESTRELLDVLAARDVKATFFLVGRNVEKHPELVRREHREGHELAGHSFTHADLGKSSKKKITSELSRTQDAIRRATGATPDLMRPPYGSTSKQLVKLAREMGMAQVMWTVDPLDWRNRDSDAVERRVVKSVKPGSIVLLHDIHRTTVRAVPGIIDELKAEGYEFVTASELFGGKLTPGKEYRELESGDGQGHP